MLHLRTHRFYLLLGPRLVRWHRPAGLTMPALRVWAWRGLSLTWVARKDYR